MPLHRRAAIRCLALALGTTLAASTSSCTVPARRSPHVETDPTPSRPAPTTGPEPTNDPAPTADPTPSTAGLPIAVHDAVIAALLPGPREQVARAGRLDHDLALHAARTGEPVAVLPARNFLREPTVVVSVRTDGDWTLVLTPARVTLPSTAGPSGAPAQSAAWARTADLPTMEPTTATVTVRVREQSLTITTPQGTRRHEVGVGQDATPTPSDVSGYLQARYVDPAQGQASSAIHLTSLHATGADEPYTGTDGGLIGIHASPLPRGRSSHGCIRVHPDVVAELATLPLGTPVVVLP